MRKTGNIEWFEWARHEAIYFVINKMDLMLVYDALDSIERCMIDELMDKGYNNKYEAKYELYTDLKYASMYRWKKYILKKANEQLLDELNKGSGN